MKDSSGRYRSYVEITCPICQNKRTVRKDGANYLMCKKCSSLKKWENAAYRKKCSNSHKGKIFSAETLEKMRLSKKGKIPKNLKLVQEIHKLPIGIASARHAYSAKKKAAIKRNHDFFLTFEEYYEIVTKDCAYCGAKPSQRTKPHSKINGEFMHNGIDRKDNDKEYELENCVPCCRRCNTLKRFNTVNGFKKEFPSIFTKPLF